MTHSVKKMAKVILALTALTASVTAFASQSSGLKQAHTGVIHFTGSIVAPPCVIETSGHKVETQCWHDNGNTKTISVDVTKLKGKDVQLPNNKGTQRFNWINKDNKLGLYTVVYD
ncbi:MAG: hypothetical protein ACTH5W_08720 [Providencia sp.]|uniref:hypothetical protein n=1 Tax=Providencia sp. TaxID=589 RepID=UPI003F9A51FC